MREELDTNGDGKVDQWQYFEGGKLDRIGYDTSGSGKVDHWDRAPGAFPISSSFSAKPAAATAPAKKK